jgi:hypothetical protein
MTPGNIIKQISNSKGQGDGFFRDLTFSPSACNVSGATRAVTDNIDRIVLDADSEVGIFNFVVPGDYDRQADKLSASFYVEYISGTAITVNVDIERIARAGAAQAAVTKDPEDVIINSAFISGYVTLTANGLGLRPGDVVSVTATASDRNTGIAHLLGGRVRYKSVLALYNESER